MKELLNFYILGIPLTTESISEDFKKFIDSDVPTLLISSVSLSDLANNDYQTAQAGYDYIFDKGYELFVPETRPKTINKHILHLPLWHTENGRKSPDDVYHDILNLYELSRKEWGDMKIAMIVPGSPYLYDAVSSRVMKHIPESNVIDTKSSTDLAVELLFSNVFKKFSNREIVVHESFNDIEIKKNAINIVGCIGAAYGQSPRKCLEQIKSNDDIFFIKIGYKTSIKRCRASDFSFRMNRKKQQLNSQLLVIIPHMDVNET